MTLGLTAKDCRHVFLIQSALLSLTGIAIGSLLGVLVASQLPALMAAIEGLTGLYLLVATSAFMSLMFPTIYGIALNGLNQDDTTLGAAGLVMAIVGGALMPILQGLMIDMDTIGPFSGVNFSFILPFVCFCFICWSFFVNRCEPE